MTEEQEKKGPSRVMYIPPWPFTPLNDGTTMTDVLGANNFLSFGTPPPHQTPSQSDTNVTSSTLKETQPQGSFIGSIFQFGAVEGQVLPTIPVNNPASPYYDLRRQSIKKETMVGKLAEGNNEPLLHSLLHTAAKASEQGIFEEQVVMPTPPLHEQLELRRQLETTERVQFDLEKLQERFSQLTADKAKSDQCVQETERLLKAQMQQNVDLELRLGQHIAVCQRDHGDKLSNLLLTLDTANRKLEEQRKSYDTEVQSLRAELASAQRLGQTAAMFEKQAEQLQKELTVANADRAAMASFRSELKGDQERIVQLQKTSELRLAEVLTEGQKQMSEIRELKTQLTKAQSAMEDLHTRLVIAESADSKSSGELTMVRKQNAELLKDNVEKTKEIADLAIQRRAEKFEVERLQSALDTQV